MIKILIHAPKGGVGKTTLATNIALFLARNNFKVWALDLAQGGLMTRFLKNTPEFNKTENKIETEEMGTIPNSFPGSQQFDFLVADTDDYFNVLAEFADARKIRGWRIVVPILNEYNGLIRISEEIREVMVANMIQGNSPFLKIFVNKYKTQEDYDSIYHALNELNLSSLLAVDVIEHSESMPPFFINDENFSSQIKALLQSMGVSI